MMTLTILLLAFEDYTPQVSFMPRISFSFDISDEAIFFAHYDVLTQRPQDRFRATPDVWYFFEASAVGGVLDNPNLRPETNCGLSNWFQTKIDIFFCIDPIWFLQRIERHGTGSEHYICLSKYLFYLQ